MAELGSLKGLTVTMKKHPSSFKLNPPLHQINAGVTGNFYRDICSFIIIDYNHIVTSTFQTRWLTICQS